MKVPHGEGVAIHIGPEPCVGTREGVSEASVGEGSATVKTDAPYRTGSNNAGTRQSETRARMTGSGRSQEKDRQSTLSPSCRCESSLRPLGGSLVSLVSEVSENPSCSLRDNHRRKISVKSARVGKIENH